MTFAVGNYSFLADWSRPVS